jgi:polyhydroxyalkanoate synthesis regulator phasin
MKKRTWLLGVAGAVAVLVVAASVGFAATGGGDANGPSFLDRVAGKLGIETDKLQQAVHDARSDEIDAAVERGDLTQEQADRLKERLDQEPLDDDFEPDFGFGHGHRRGHDSLHPGLGPVGGAGDLAAFLGIDVPKLREELGADGASLASVAEAHGKSRDDLKAFLQQKVGERIDAAVADGDLTDEQAAAMKAKLSSHLDELIDAHMPRFKRDGFPGRGPFGPHPQDEAAPSTDSSSNSSFRF